MSQASPENRPALPSGTVTFLFTDIEGSSQLAQQYPADMDSLLNHQDSILRQSIEAHQGQIFRVVGDSYAAAFQTAGDALLAAIQAQLHLQQTDWQPVRLKVRMGIHTGPAQAGILPQEPGGYSGYMTLTRANRIMSTASGEQILLSNASAGLLGVELPGGAGLRDLGEHRLKGLQTPERLWQATAPGLRADFPPLASLNRIPNNLPEQVSSFIGREREIAKVISLLETSRLLTLTGVGGVGKTRLSLQAAAESLEAFKDGVWLVELAPLTDPGLLPQRIAASLGVRETAGRPLEEALLDYLRAKQLLLILDNCEHLVEACARLADEILRACSEVRLIASSREALGIAGETVLQVPSLGLPSGNDRTSFEDTASSESIQLFVERARAVLPGFTLTGGNIPVVSDICRRLDGIPLAIELAAARLKLFSPEQILVRLDNRFRLLTGGSRTALPRQQTLQALIDWSYDLLPEAERHLLQWLSVFASGWTFEAAEAVCGPDSGQTGDPAGDVLDLLARLVDKSLVSVDFDGSSREARYRFLETIRQYASGKLFTAGEAGRARDRHLNYFSGFVAGGEPDLLGADQLRELERFELEHDNLRASLAWGLENDPEAALRMAGSMFMFWNIHGYLREGRDWIDGALARVEALPPLEGQAERERITAQAKAHFGRGILSIAMGENAEGSKAFRQSAVLARRIGDNLLLARALSMLGTTAQWTEGNQAFTVESLEESVALSRETGDNWSLAITYGLLSNYARAHGDFTAASAYMQESYQLNRDAKNPWMKAMGMLGVGIIASQQGDFEQARPRFEEALVLFRKIGDKHRTSMALSELAHLERRRGNYEQALALYQETILAWLDLGHRAAVGHQLENIAFIAAAQGQTGRAAQLLGAAGALRESINAPMTPQEHVEYEAVLDNLRAHSDAETFEQVWELGRKMSMEETIAFALEPLEGINNSNAKLASH